jgi:hypothetical protein
MSEARGHKPATVRLPSEYDRDGRPARIVCAALALAVLVLALRIAAVLRHL